MSAEVDAVLVVEGRRRRGRAGVIDSVAEIDIGHSSHRQVDARRPGSRALVRHGARCAPSGGRPWRLVHHASCVLACWSGPVVGWARRRPWRWRRSRPGRCTRSLAGRASLLAGVVLGGGLPRATTGSGGSGALEHLVQLRGAGLARARAASLAAREPHVHVALADGEHDPDVAERLRVQLAG